MATSFANTHIDKNYLSHDYDDLMSVVDAAIAERLGGPRPTFYVTGGSGGGALTAWIVGKTARLPPRPLQWSGDQLDQRGADHRRLHLHGHRLVREDAGSDPDGHWKRLAALAGRQCGKTPTLVIVGTDDHRTPPYVAEQFFDSMQLREVPTAMIQVPGASLGGLAERPSQSGCSRLRGDPRLVRPLQMSGVSRRSQP